MKKNASLGRYNLFFSLTFCTLLFICMCACGKRGEPLPPSLVVPEKITDLKLYVKPGVQELTWSIPRKNSDNSKPLDLVAFNISLKKVHKDLDSCRYCDEGFNDFLTINLLKPKSGYQLGSSFYLLVPEISSDYIYVFSVESLNSRGWRSEVSNKLAVFSLPSVAPPVHVELTPSASIVELNWQAPVLPSDFSGNLLFRVYRRQSDISDSNWRLITPEAVSDPHFIDVGLDDWLSYEYAITSVLINDQTSSESDYSTIAQVTPGDYTPPAALEQFSVFNYEVGVQLVWNPSSSSDLAGYNVYRRDDISGLDQLIAVTSISQPEYFDEVVVIGRTYYYRVTAFDSSDRKNESKPTSEISVTVK